MKGKHLLLLTVVAAILVGMALLTTRKQDKASSTAIGSKVIPGLAINDIQTVEIKATASSVTVAKIDGIWRVANRHNYPADFGKIRELLTKLADLKTLQSIRATEQQRRELQLLPGSTSDALTQPTILDLKDASGKSRETLLLGKERMRPSSSPEASPYDNFPDGRFIATSKGNIVLVGDALSEAVTTPRSWMDEEFVKVPSENLASIAISGSTNGTILLTRTNGNSEFTIPHIPEGKEADSAKLSRLTSALNYLRFEDIATPGTPDDKTGLDKPITFTAKTFNGESYTITIGHSSAQESKYFARVAASFTAPPAAANTNITNQLATAQAAQNEKSATDAKILSDKLAPWTYILDSYSAESLTMGFADLLKDKPKSEEKKSEP